MAVRDSTRRFSHHKFTLTLKPWDRNRELVDLSWSVVCKDGAVSLNCGSFLDSNKIVDWGCGIEFHRRVPLDDEAPMFTNCYLLGGFCWHSGSSMAASDFWRQEGGLRAYESGDHAFIFSHLEYQLSRLFEGTP